MLPELVMIVTAPLERLPDGRLRLDARFIEGLALHAAHWDGPLRCIIWEGGPVPFGREMAEADLAMPLTVLPEGAALTRDHLAGAGIVLAAADGWRTHALPDLCGPGVKLVYAIEYTLATRLDILRLDKGIGWLRRLRSMLWVIRQERRMRRAFRRAAGLQCNGDPAFEAYGRLVPDVLRYHDGRMDGTLFAQASEQAIRLARRLHGGPLRLVNFGRLEPMKGAQDLVPFARALRARSVDFTLDIFGTGSLEAQLRDEIAAARLEARVRLHAPVPFESELVPWMRQEADIFLSCHRQDDPSCAYLEAMGCGLPVLGYANRMLERLVARVGAGWTVQFGDPVALAREAALLAAAPEEVSGHSERALAFARAHSASKEFAARMEQLARLAAG